MAFRNFSINIYYRYFNNPTWLWTRLVIGVLGLSIYFARLISRSPQFSSIITNPILVVLLFTGAFILFTRSPLVGIALLIFVSLISTFFPKGGVFGFLNSTVLLIAFLLGHWSLDSIVRQRKINPPKSGPVIPLIILVLITLISFGIGQLNWFFYSKQAPLDAQIAGMALIIFSIGAFLLMAYQVNELVWLKRLTWLFIFLGGFYILGRTIPGLSQYINLIFVRSATGGASLFWIWLISLSLSQAMYNTDLKSRWRVALFGLVLATMYVSMVQAYGWKSGWIPSIFVISFLIFLRYPKIGLLLIVIGGIISSDVISQILVSDEYSYVTRIAAWEIVVGDIVKVSPIFGLGPANYRLFTSQFAILGYNVPFNSHNNYIDILAQIGLVGLVVFLWFYFEIGRLGWRLRTQRLDGFSKAYVFGVLGG